MEVVEGTGGREEDDTQLVTCCRLTVHNYRYMANRNRDEMGHQESWLWVHLLLPRYYDLTGT